MNRGMLQTLRPLWPYLWRYRGNFAWGLAALALKDLAAVSAPLVIRAAVDRFSRGAPAAQIFRLAGYLAAHLAGHPAGAAGEFRRHLFRAQDTRPLRADSGHVLRHQQPRAGEPRRRAHGPRLRAGGGRAEKIQRAECGLYRAEYSARAHLRAVRAAAGAVDRVHLPDRAVGGRTAC